MVFCPKIDERITSEMTRCLSYDAETGIISRKILTGNAKTKPDACILAKDGYLRISFCSRYHQAHRVAWLLHWGEWPQIGVDHINGQRDDNRISNLRLATHSQNCQNRKLDVKRQNNLTGAVKKSRGKRWSSRISVNGKLIYLGSFSTPEDAHQAYRSASAKYHGEYGNRSIR